MIQKSKRYVFLLVSIIIFSGNYLEAAEEKILEEEFSSRLTLAESVLIEREFVDYFKKIANSDYPITISVKAQDVYGKREEYENQKDFPRFSENEITQSFLLRKFEGLSLFLSTAFEKYPSDIYEIKASIGVNAPGHREKVNGFCSTKFMQNGS